MTHARFRPLRLPPRTLALLGCILLVLGLLAALPLGCARGEQRLLTATAYCGCGECNGYSRGHWIFLKLDFWNCYINYGAHRGEPYTGRTASGDRLRLPHPGLLSCDSLLHPWMVPFRAVAPWLWLPQDGTVAADTDYYPFGTRIYVPGYGWGQVQDRGGAIKGPDHIDLFMITHARTEQWGRPKVEVTIRRPD